ncbi:MAG: UDP-N-acetylglucosamine 2-epimerase [Chloroflexi bacterium]|nr:UDP-N-acetylglucosamine 2-epimerase [Chloroflexota bacterium]
MSGKVLIPVSVRPNFPKVAPVIYALEQREVSAVVVHTQRHHDFSLSQQFFEQLNLPEPKYRYVETAVGYQNTDGLSSWFFEVIDRESPDIVYVHGDTAMVPPAILAAKSLRRISVHEEAGLRAGAVITLEERNRRLADHLADLLVAPTQRALQNLISEGIDPSRVLCTGNPIVDAVQLALSHEPSEACPRDVRPYLAVSVHRPENTSSPQRVERFIRQLQRIATAKGWRVLIARHPRLIRALEYIGQMPPPAPLILLPWLGFIDFVHVLKGAEVFITDSGTSQEEICVTHTPTITILSQTDRPETIEIGANRLVMDLRLLESAVEAALSSSPRWDIMPFGDGKAGSRIADWLLEYILRGGV